MLHKPHLACAGHLPQVEHATQVSHAVLRQPPPQPPHPLAALGKVPQDQLCSWQLAMLKLQNTCHNFPEGLD